MNSDRAVTPVTDPASSEFVACARIYERSFPPEEKAPFDQLWRWIHNPPASNQPALWALVSGGAVIGFACFSYWHDENVGYLAYIALDDSTRGQGHGTWLCEQVFARIEQLALARWGRPPRLCFWEARSPAEASTEEEWRVRERRIEFYRKLGAERLPVVYFCPPVAAGQPVVRFAVMVRTYPPSRAVSRQDAIDVTLLGLITINGAEPTSWYVAEALSSLQARESQA